MALAHGVGVVSVHRALADVDTLARTLTAVAELGVDLGEFLERGMRPKVLVEGVVCAVDDCPLDRGHSRTAYGTP